jgi:hypothetical protein
MKLIQDRIEAQVEVFVGNLQELMREAAIEAVERAIGVRDRPKARRETSGRRRPEEVAALTDALYAAICAQPGASMTTIGQAIGRRTDELSLCAHRLLCAGRVRKVGQRNQTRYFPVDAPAKRPGPRAKR